MPDLKDRSPQNVMDLPIDNEGGLNGGVKDDGTNPGSTPSPRDKNANVASATDNKLLDTPPGLDVPPRQSRVSSRNRIATKPSRYLELVQAETAAKVAAAKVAAAATPTTTPNSKKETPSPSDNKKNNGVSSATKVRKIPTPSTKKVKPATGVWSDEEEEWFAAGLVACGWGDWKAVAEYVPSRERDQVKSHAQKFALHHAEKKKKLLMQHEAAKKKDTSLTKKKSPPKMKEPVVAKKRKPANKDIEVEAAPIKKAKPSSSKRAVQNKSPLLDETKPSVAIMKKESKNLFLEPDERIASPETLPAKHDAEWMGPRKMSPKKAPPVPKSATRERKSSKRTKTPGHGPWTDAEQLQFSQACILHGWGAWGDIASVVTTRTRNQVKSHAQKFGKHRPDEKARLDKEHKLLVKVSGGSTTSKGKKKPTTKRLPLLKNRAAVNGWSLVEEKQFEDACIFHGYGNWVEISNHIITKDVEQVKAYASLLDQEEKQMLMSEHTLNYSHEEEEKKEAEPAKVSALATDNLMSPVPKTTKHDLGAAEAIMALNFSNWKEEEPKQPSSRVDNIGAAMKSEGTYSSAKAAESKSNVGGTEDSELSTPVNSSATSSQPPPHWLAQETWEECLVNIHNWTSKLTEDQRNAEYVKYDSLPDDEKERLRQKLVLLMNNRPSGGEK